MLPQSTRFWQGLSLLCWSPEPSDLLPGSRKDAKGITLLEKSDCKGKQNYKCRVPGEVSSTAAAEVVGQKKSRSGEPAQTNSNGTQWTGADGTRELLCMEGFGQRYPARCHGHSHSPRDSIFPSSPGASSCMSTHQSPQTPAQVTGEHNGPSTESGKVVLNNFPLGDFQQKYKTKIPLASNQPRQDDPTQTSERQPHPTPPPVWLARVETVLRSQILRQQQSSTLNVPLHR